MAAARKYVPVLVALVEHGYGNLLEGPGIPEAALEDAVRFIMLSASENSQLQYACRHVLAHQRQAFSQWCRRHADEVAALLVAA